MIPACIRKLRRPGFESARREAAGLLVFLLVTNVAVAQSPPPYSAGGVRNLSRPTTSPYLNLLRRGGQQSMALRYYRGVRPEIDLRQAGVGLGQELQGLNQELRNSGLLDPTGAQQVSPTGHTTSFLDVRGYFPPAGASSLARSSQAIPRRRS
jgi:hypothetical protein